MTRFHGGPWDSGYQDVPGWSVGSPTINPGCIHVHSSNKHWFPCMYAQSCLTLTTPWTVARQAPLSVEFSRQEYRSKLPFPPSGDLPNPRIKPRSPVSPELASRFLTTVSPGKPLTSNRAHVQGTSTERPRRQEDSADSLKTHTFTNWHYAFDYTFPEWLYLISKFVIVLIIKIWPCFLKVIYLY